MGFKALFVVLLVFYPAIFAQKFEEATLVIDTTAAVAETDANYICVTLDWWPEDKCNYKRCPWGLTSVLSLNLSHPFLSRAILAFKSLRVRIGGSLQDSVVYDRGNFISQCQLFKKQWGGLFGFSTGCLRMDRWDDLNDFFKKTGVILTFGLNALYGRHHVLRFWGGDWDPSNARNFIAYTLSKGYHVDSWEFGNELSGFGTGASIGAEQYGKDTSTLKAMLDNLYQNSSTRPSIIAPGGFYASWWFNEYLQASGPDVVNIVSHHLYTLGQGNSPNMKSRILNPKYLDKAASILKNVNETIEKFGPWASAWVSESGGSVNNGAMGISNTFLNSFWYLDQLALAAKYNTRVYCRQTLVGGFYELLDQNTFVPNPDYYSALLWHRLMGKRVLSVKTSASKSLRAYAHCTKERDGITLLLINLSDETTYTLEVESTNYIQLLSEYRRDTKKRSFIHRLKKLASLLGNRASDERLAREEYHLTPENGDLQSKIMLLNEKPIQLTDKGEIPGLDPVLVDMNSPLTVSPLSIKFVVLPNFHSPGCK